MEINKSLHQHAWRVALAVASLVLISGVAVNQFRTSDGVIWRALVTQVLEVEPGSNGLGKASINQELKPAQSAGPLQALEQTGRSAQLTFLTGL